MAAGAPIVSRAVQASSSRVVNGIVYMSLINTASGWAGNFEWEYMGGENIIPSYLMQWSRECFFFYRIWTNPDS
jgi:hypothetical protein